MTITVEQRSDEVSRVLGAELRSLRKGHGWTRRDLLERSELNIALQTLATYELGTRQCTVVRLPGRGVGGTAGRVGDPGDAANRGAESLWAHCRPARGCTDHCGRTEAVPRVGEGLASHVAGESGPVRAPRPCGAGVARQGVRDRSRRSCASAPRPPDRADLPSQLT